MEATKAVRASETARVDAGEGRVLCIGALWLPGAFEVVLVLRECECECEREWA